MSQKRQLGEEGTSSDDRRRRRLSLSFRRLVLDVMSLQRLQYLLTPVMEPIFRRVVKEEVDSAMRRHMINRERNDILQSEPRNLVLQFSNAISHPVYTRTRIEGEGSIAIAVTLVDASDGQVVSSGLGSFAEVEIVVLNGEFGGDGGENWRLEEFTRSIVREREGNKRLLIGDVILTLKDGKGVGHVSFTDRSRKTRSGKFRLGARLMDNIDGIRVREAISKPFIVKTPPRDAQKKHNPPSPSDEVWRLDNISKGGQFHQRLNGEGVKTVQDFLTLFFSEPERLQHILGTTMSKRKWEVTVQHAQRCVLDRKIYVYDGSAFPQTNGVVFNIVRQVMGMFKDGQYVSADKLSDADKVHARELVISALDNHDKVLTLSDQSSLSVPLSLPWSNAAHQDLNSHDIEAFPYSQQHGASYIGGTPSIDGFLHNSEPMDFMYDQPMSFPNRVSDILINGMSCANEQLNYSEMDSATIINDSTPSVVSINKARRGWDMLVSLLRWRFAIKRILARKTRVLPIKQDDDDDAWTAYLQV